MQSKHPPVVLRCAYSQKAASDTAKTAKSATASIRNFLKAAIVVSLCVLLWWC